MEVHFGGAYRKFSLIQSGVIIQLHNRETGHIKDFMKMNGKRDNMYLSSVGERVENKKIKAYIHRKWSIFKKDSYKETTEETLSEFLLNISKGIRDYKLDDLI